MRNIIVVILICLSSTLAAYAEAPKKGGMVQHWFTPAILSSENTSVTFELDSTWHTVHGQVPGVSGEVSLKNPANPLSVQVSAKMKVSSFDTDSNMRDSKMRDVMDAESFPVVTFIADGLKKNCTPALVLKNGKCDDELGASLTIRDVTKKFIVPVSISSAENAFLVKGALPISWMEFGVEDPSILIASVDPTVTIHFEVMLKAPQ